MPCVRLVRDSRAVINGGGQRPRRRPFAGAHPSGCADDLPAGWSRYFVHNLYLVPRKRFMWYESALQVHFVLFERFISYRIGAHGRTSVINGSGQRPRRRPSLALIPPAAPAPPIYEVMGDHGSPPGPLPASHCHGDIRCLLLIVSSRRMDALCRTCRPRHEREGPAIAGGPGPAESITSVLHSYML